MAFLAFADLGVQLLKLARRHVQVERDLGQFALQHAETAGQSDAKLRHQFRLQFAVALRLRRLTLQRIHLAADFFQDVEDARQICLGRFELRFGEPLLCLETRDAGGFFDDRAAVLRLGAEDLPDASLLDDRVALRPKAACP